MAGLLGVLALLALGLVFGASVAVGCYLAMRLLRWLETLRAPPFEPATMISHLYGLGGPDEAIVQRIEKTLAQHRATIANNASR